MQGKGTHQRSVRSLRQAESLWQELNVPHPHGETYTQLPKKCRSKPKQNKQPKKGLRQPRLAIHIHPSIHLLFPVFITHRCIQISVHIKSIGNVKHMHCNAWKHTNFASLYVCYFPKLLHPHGHLMYLCALCNNCVKTCSTIIRFCEEKWFCFQK